MVVSKKANIPRCDLFSKGEKIKQSERSKYLGYMLTSDGEFKNLLVLLIWFCSFCWGESPNKETSSTCSECVEAATTFALSCFTGFLDVLFDINSFVRFQWILCCQNCHKSVFQLFKMQHFDKCNPAWRGHFLPRCFPPGCAGGRGERYNNK